MIKLTLFEGGLNDDYVEVDKTGETTLYYYTYANAWGNHEHKKTFSKIDYALDWYQRKFMDRAIYQGRVWLTEGCPEEYPKKDSDGIVITTDDDAMNEWENLTYYCELD